ncbi:MAG: hypothetical protein ACLTW9_23500 [Enterocloster sp.]
MWYEYKGKAYTLCAGELLTVISGGKSRRYMMRFTKGLNDLISVICPIESQGRSCVWEKGARSIIMAVCLAMLEDSEYRSWR